MPHCVSPCDARPLAPAHRPRFSRLKDKEKRSRGARKLPVRDAPERRERMFESSPKCTAESPRTAAPERRPKCDKFYIRPTTLESNHKALAPDGDARARERRGPPPPTQHENVKTDSYDAQ